MGSIRLGASSSGWTGLSTQISSAPFRTKPEGVALPKHRLNFILSSLQNSTAPALKHQAVFELGKRDPGTTSPWSDILSHHLIPHGGTTPCPATSKHTLARESQSHQAVISASTSLQEQNVDAAQDTLAGEGLQGLERMTGLQERPTLASSIIDLARAHCITARIDRLLEMALQLSGRTRETRQALVAMAGDWYPLCQQLSCHDPESDLPGSMAVFMEVQRNLASMVQRAAKSEPVGNKDRNSTGHREAHLQMRGRLEEVETHAKQCLDIALASGGFHELWEESIENSCLLWLVAVQDLLQCLLSRLEGLFLLPLRQAVKDQQRLQEGLAQATHVSQRLPGCRAYCAGISK